MAEQQEKKSVAPGIIKSSYTKTKNQEHNRTMQRAVEELPTTEKSVMYREYYATMVSTAIGMPIDREFSMEFITGVAAVVAEPIKSPYKNLKRNDKVDKVSVEDINNEMLTEPKFIEIPQTIEGSTTLPEPSDMEVAMEYMTSLPEIAQHKVDKQPDLDMMADIPVEPVKNVNNVFGTINTAQFVVDTDTEKTIDIRRDQFKEIKPFMVVDKVEVRMMKNDSGETMYMIGKEVCDYAKFTVYKQEVAGKILSMECKRLELDNVVYTRQKDGVYINNNNDVVTMDDLLDILHG